MDLTQVLTLGAVLATLVLAIPQAISVQATLESARGQSRNLEQQQLTERFSKAVEQLGNRDNLEVRLGGIYALERIARDSAPDQPAVVNVLSAFVRENTSALRDPQGRCPDRAPTADVQAAITVIARRDPLRDDPTLWPRVDLTAACLRWVGVPSEAAEEFTSVDFTGADLANASLNGANLAGAFLAGAFLADADFTGANLTRADLESANLESATLNGANLTRAFLAGANLTRAFLGEADLTQAYLADANLTQAYLIGANLTQADFTGANLTRAYLADANLTGVVGLPPR